MIAPIYKTITTLRQKLDDESKTAGFWEGELSSSALATATAVFALATANMKLNEPLIRRGLGWLRDNINDDGGWGDTVDSKSNISTTALCWAAFTTGNKSQYLEVVDQAENWLTRQAGGLEADKLAQAICRRYGKDRTFAVPILTMCALSGRLGYEQQAWRWIKPLPFELAVLPHRWWKWLRLTVVSYALPALIAVGQVIFYKRPPKNPLVRLIRRWALKSTLEKLRNIQPASGGFLEAIPLTSFVVMSLAAAGQKENIVVKKGVEFITSSMRRDGSWPIDTNLATWVTTLSVNAQAVDPEFSHILSETKRRKIADWLTNQQYRQEHPYTHAAPGGWAWTNMSGAVPDADDTAGAIVALGNLGVRSDQITEAVKQGVNWLLDLQNGDGGIPTFCKGWGKLPFDRSAPDLTAHAIRAWATWYDELPKITQKKVNKAITKGNHYLRQAQKADGHWVPLWFGNQHTPNEENPVYGTARVMSAMAEVMPRFEGATHDMLLKGAQWLLSAQHDDGSWGGSSDGVSSIEETALAVEALAKLAEHLKKSDKDELPETFESAIISGTNWLIERTEEGNITEAAPIGLYFARLWYSEKLYPLIFTLAALEQVKKIIGKTIVCPKAVK
jgi:squalene-hopene/tetraprenyl-beta-curcumene cyclase